ncbi:retropepsin-like domain-containing protein [Sphaerospermopsis sp. FACHB-1094]|uniref:retropepsin-like domain-containing protein n=1 Tax=Sphaerospermopsis sp. FACHB-1094 TaxID=2692861 RepID=UPI0016850AFD|nr:retropepsin-like domain-containing protein [Sphaerospermopsis sp. FACHB-1094]MBD2133893.1 retropepsin-like domain-containing protein [Sphaerospermopsis sp. FACHB-1094]
MNTTPSPSERDEILKRLNKNRHQLLDLYKNQYVAYNSNGIIAHSENLQEVLELAKATKQNFLIYLVPHHTASVQILPIRFRTVARHDWQPNYSVKLKHGNIEFSAIMLVDSGAELSLISLKVGQDLGYALADSESTLLAETIGGRVEYVLRNVEMTIDGYNLIAPVAWLQSNTGGEQLLLGREVVFDKFNIEFGQAEEKIIFSWRENLH